MFAQTRRLCSPSKKSLRENRSRENKGITEEVELKNNSEATMVGEGYNDKREEDPQNERNAEKGDTRRT